MSFRDSKHQSIKEKGYKRLQIWQKGKIFLKEVYKQSEIFPKSEAFGLTSQLKRATLSYLLNIVEGQRRTSKKEFLKFLNIAESSLVEVEACLEIGHELNYLSTKVYEDLEKQRQELAKMTRAFTRKVTEQLNS